MPKLGPSPTDSQEQVPPGETVNLEFEGFSLSDVDSDGIKRLLDQLFLQYPVNTSDLTAYLIENKQVGTVVKNIPSDEPPAELEDDAAADSDDNIVFSITSLVNLSIDRDQHCVQQIVDLLKLKCASGDGKGSEIIRLLNSPEKAKIGLLLNERFVNLPAQLTLQPIEALVSEMKAATSRKKRYEFTHFLMLCKARKTIIEQRPGKRPKMEIIFTNAEDEIIQEEADLVCRFSVSDASPLAPSGDNEEGEPFCTVLVFSANKLTTVISKLKSQVF